MVQLDLITKYSLIHSIHPNRMSLEISVLTKNTNAKSDSENCLTHKMELFAIRKLSVNVNSYFHKSFIFKCLTEFREHLYYIVQDFFRVQYI